jgi:hypothetical protein|tara:strand:+ start:698 stop:946 length:249 start_codon:yes stop_codon:yes gene_type:complete
MRLIKSFGKRNGYLQEMHVAFLIKAKYQRRGGVFLHIFVEASIDAKGVRSVSLRENGTNDKLYIDHLEKKDDLYELINKQLQ